MAKSGLKNAGFHVTGMDVVDRKLSSFDDKVQKKLIRKALRNGAKLIAGTAKSAAPKDGGLLKTSIKPKAAKRSRKTAHQVTVRVVSGMSTHRGEFYPGGFIEYGTQYQPAQPFMRPAAKQQRQAVINLFRKDVAEAVKELAKK